ncbi:PREDICTED: cytochrome P450 6a2 [Drosophila arizonae]|uniref:Cytochrome P450 6a2 n=1 Tax=Drosophila arizonae TaxID=7263 RepID=A0ABM1PJG6_DROAR|nr:PREDICTED: cytochrome P450 6a2 [Drosophila arizonae]
MLFIIYLLSAISALLVYLLHRNMNYWKSRGIPQEPPHLIYGNVVGFRKTRVLNDLVIEYYNKFRKSGHPFVGFAFIQKQSAFIMDTKLAKNILIKDFANFADRGQFHNEHNDPLTGHLFNLDGKRWREMRQKLSPTFTSGKMKFMFPTVIKVSEEFVEVMMENVPAKTGGAIIEIKDLMARFTTDVSSTMTYALYELAQHTDIQDRLREDIQEVLQQHDGKLTYECVKAMRYLDQVISETLRLYTLVPFLERKALNDYVVPGHPKYVIEKGTQIILPAAAYHRDEDLYPEPEKFDPERFSPEQVAARDSVEWLPFGDGPRNCVGMRFGQMQTRIGLAQLLRNFKFTVCDKTDIPLIYDPKSLIIGTIGGIYLRVERV